MSYSFGFSGNVLAIECNKAQVRRPISGFVSFKGFEEPSALRISFDIDNGDDGGDGVRKKKYF